MIAEKGMDLNSGLHLYPVSFDHGTKDAASTERNQTSSLAVEEMDNYTLLMDPEYFRTKVQSMKQPPELSFSRKFRNKQIETVTSRIVLTKRLPYYETSIVTKQSRGEGEGKHVNISNLSYIPLSLSSLLTFRKNPIKIRRVIG